MASSRIDLVIHGVLVNVGGTGVLLTGEPGIGKSECALELLNHGHKLIADDIIEVAIIRDYVIGSAPERFKGLLEVRDLGIIDVKQIFGGDAFESNHRIDLTIKLLSDDLGQAHDRIGVALGWHEILQIKIPKYEITVGRNRNSSLLVETAAKICRNQINSAENSLISSHNMLVSSAAGDDMSNRED